MDDKETFRLLEHACNCLIEHFDCVQIFVSVHDPDAGTANASWGAGNWFARKGQVQDWLTKKNEETRVYTRKENE
jgi:hypothetical protein